jgi:hypothetical protein
MDPTACLLRAANALSDGDHEECCNALDDYLDWRNTGGFEPQDVCGKSGDVFAADCVHGARLLRRKS